ncbi:MAG TPA: hypothetical protein VER17_03245 [Tepidisphaeraceae bacterium]|nr:hypothetical protein [Tepidisphaeraceae bacterium]
MRLPGPRILRLFPLVALVGVEGFNFFAPYLVLVLSLAYVARQVKSPAAADPALIPVNA